MSRTPPKTWREGWWPADPDVEAFLKARILVAEPTATFFYAPEFRAHCEAQARKRAAAQCQRTEAAA